MEIDKTIKIFDYFSNFAISTHTNTKHTCIYSLFHSITLFLSFPFFQTHTLTYTQTLTYTHYIFFSTRCVKDSGLRSQKY